MENKNLTAVEWLVLQVNSDCLNSAFIRPELVDQAIEMEKEQRGKPIELPSDDEIELSSFKMSGNNVSPSSNFIIGAYWMKEQILNQNKKETLEEWKARFTHHCAIKPKTK